MTAVLPGSGLAALLAGKPHFWHIRESFDEFPFLWRIYQIYIFLLSRKILCVSTPIADQFSPRWRKKTIVLHNGFPISEFAPVSQERIKNTHMKWGLDEKSIAIGVVGRIKMKRKGQEIFVQAASIVKNKFPEARFLCIGSPFPGNEDHLDRLLSLVKALKLEKEFIYTGEAEDIKAAMAALDILVLSSVQAEPFGGVVIEAMAFKKPVVATAIGGSLEQVDDGKTGFLVHPGDPEDMAAALTRLIGDPELRERMGSNGYKRYIENFEFEPFYKKITGLYLKEIQRSV
jgi:glycosyltransferase involved in cell wall biosynthesis